MDVENNEDSTSEEYLEVEPEMPMINMQADSINIDDALNEHSEDEIYDEDSDEYQSETGSNINDFLEVEIDDVVEEEPEDVFVECDPGDLINNEPSEDPFGELQMMAGNSNATSNQDAAIKNNKCHICGKVFCTPVTLQTHIKSIHEGVKEYKCEFCNKEFTLIGQRNWHVKTTHGKSKDHKCVYCQKKLGSTTALKSHIEKRHPEQKYQAVKQKKYQCPHCNESFTHKAHMKEHIKNSHGDKVTQKCDLCEKTFSTSTILQSHIRTIHEGIYDYKCKYCEKGFGMIGSLNWHIKTVHDNDKEDTNLKCNSCGEQFASRKSLRTHIISAHRLPKVLKVQSTSSISLKLPKSISIVPALSIQKSQIKGGPKLLHCNKCKKSFAKQIHLTSHMKYAHPEVWKCDLCDKLFTDEGSLRVHETNIHHVKPYQCSECQKRFSLPFQLQQHKKVCTNTPQTSNQQPTVTAYRYDGFKIVSETLVVDEDGAPQKPLNPHVCQHCGEAFTSMFYLINHINYSCNSVSPALTKNGRAIPQPWKAPSGVFPNLSTKLKNTTTTVNPQFSRLASVVRPSVAPDPAEIVQEKKHKCNKCSAQYQQRSSLKAHMRICGLSKNFKCKLCDNAYAEQRGLDKHFKDIHASHHPCQYCTLAFKTPEALEFHLYRIHKCKSCGKVFSDIMGLKSHVVCEIKGDVNNTDDHGIKNSEDTNMIVEKKKDFYRCHNLKKTMIADGTIALEQEQQIIPDKKSSSSSEIISTTTFPPFKEESIEIKEECFDNDDEDIIISDDNLDDDDYEEEEPNVEEILP